jgi:hypothetical protein
MSETGHAQACEAESLSHHVEATPPPVFVSTE